MEIKYFLALFLLFASTGLAFSSFYPNENAQFIVRAEDAFGQAISANCSASILYPDKTPFMTNQTMTLSPYGNFYINFTAPSILGMYEEIAQCQAITVIGVRNLWALGSFKVEINPATEVNLTNITNQLNEINSSFTNQLTEINNSLTYLNGSVSYMNNTVNNINSTTNQIYNFSNDINYTVTQINLTTTNINTTVNNIDYIINNFNTTIVANITANITGNYQVAIDDLWRKIRNLMIALWSSKPDWYNFI